jgi:hypothetical protein
LQTFVFLLQVFDSILKVDHSIEIRLTLKDGGAVIAEGGPGGVEGELVVLFVERLKSLVSL